LSVLRRLRADLGPPNRLPVARSPVTPPGQASLPTWRPASSAVAVPAASRGAPARASARRDLVRLDHSAGPPLRRARSAALYGTDSRWYPTWVGRWLLSIGVGKQSFDGGAEFGQVVVHRGGEDGVAGVEVAVR